MIPGIEIRLAACAYLILLFSYNVGMKLCQLRKKLVKQYKKFHVTVTQRIFSSSQTAPIPFLWENNPFQATCLFSAFNQNEFHSCVPSQQPKHFWRLKGGLIFISAFSSISLVFLHNWVSRFAFFSSNSFLLFLRLNFLGWQRLIHWQILYDFTRMCSLMNKLN